MRNTVLVGLLALALPACLVGTGDISSDPGAGGQQGGGGGQQGGGGGGGEQGGGGGGGGTTPTPKVAATVDHATVSSELGKTETLTVTLTGTDGFAGDVTLAPTIVDSTGNPVTGFTLTANPTTVTLAQNGTGTATISVKIPTDAAELAPMVKVAATSTAAAVEADSTFTIAKQLTITIAAGTGSTAIHSALPAPNAPISILAGTKVIFHNADTINHEIHASGGINHEQGALVPGGDYSAVVSSDADWYCHDHEGNSNIDRIIRVVQ